MERFKLSWFIFCRRIRKRLCTGTLPVNKKHLTGTVPVNKKHLTGTVIFRFSPNPLKIPLNVAQKVPQVCPEVEENLEL